MLSQGRGLRLRAPHAHRAEAASPGAARRRAAGHPDRGAPSAPPQRARARTAAPGRAQLPPAGQRLASDRARARARHRGAHLKGPRRAKQRGRPQSPRRLRFSSSVTRAPPELSHRRRSPIASHLTFIRNAALSLNRRRRMVGRVVGQGWSLTKAAEAAGVSERTCAKWVAPLPRARARRGLLDRSSAPQRGPAPHADERVEVDRAAAPAADDRRGDRRVPGHGAVDRVGGPDADRAGQARAAGAARAGQPLRAPRTPAS